MITALFIIGCLLLVFLINTLIRSNEIKNHPEKSIRDNEKNIQSRTSMVLNLSLIPIIMGVVFINFIYDAEPKDKEARVKTTNSDSLYMGSIDSIIESSSKYNIPDVEVSPEKIAETERILNDVRVASAESRKISASKKSKDEVELLFSAWNGSLPSLVDYVKDNMHNPSSFDHVESEWRDDGDGITVRMKYRGENGFGAVRLQTATAKADYDGNVLYLISNK